MLPDLFYRLLSIDLDERALPLIIGDQRRGLIVVDLYPSAGCGLGVVVPLVELTAAAVADTLTLWWGIDYMVRGLAGSADPPAT